MPDPMSRRRMMRYGLGAAGATLAAGVLEGQPAGRASARAGSPALRPERRPRELPQPRVLRSTGGLLDVRLTAVPAVVDMGAPRLVRTYTWNKVVPGHTWEIRAGDTLKVHLRNRLPHLPPPEHMVMDRPHEWTHTNLHTHGLHVSPAGNADNVFIDIPPGQRSPLRDTRARRSPGRAQLVPPAQARRGHPAAPGRAWPARSSCAARLTG